MSCFNELTVRRKKPLNRKVFKSAAVLLKSATKPRNVRGNTAGLLVKHG